MSEGVVRARCSIRERMALGLMAQAVAVYYDQPVVDVLDDVARFAGAIDGDDIHGPMVKASIDYLAGRISLPPE